MPLVKFSTHPQAAAECVDAEQRGLATRQAPRWALPWTPAWTPPDVLAQGYRPRVAVLREEGSNGDREMAAALHAAGLEPWDVAMSDLLAGRARLDGFSGLVCVGGFSYADVLDSAKGWAGAIRRNRDLWAQFVAFRERPDTFRWVHAIYPDTGGGRHPRWKPAYKEQFVAFCKRLNNHESCSSLTPTQVRRHKKRPEHP